MALYSANRHTRTLTLHKNHQCRYVPKKDLQKCGCGSTGEKQNHHWWCEDHITITNINRFMNNRFWAILLCGNCYEDVLKELSPIKLFEYDG